MILEDIYNTEAAQKIIRDRIREAINDTRLSSDKVSEMSGYSPSYLRRMRNGSGCNPTISGLWALAKALDVNPYWLVGAPRVAKRKDTGGIFERNDVLVSDVIDKASELFCVHRRDILGPYRYNFLMPARFALCKALRERGLSFPHIGRVLNRDHSTVIYSVQRAEYMMERDSGYAKKVQTLIDLRPEPVALENEDG